jgi:hypothetical protein
MYAAASSETTDTKHSTFLAEPRANTLQQWSRRAQSRFRGEAANIFEGEGDIRRQFLVGLILDSNLIL